MVEVRQALAITRFAESGLREISNRISALRRSFARASPVIVSGSSSIASSAARALLHDRQ
ncbi:MAG: hypothetical protein JWO14_2878 [Solirubrobacterales bacterium]|nr:hypothetical protein [Solirubrobacterales bacterium]